MVTKRHMSVRPFRKTLSFLAGCAFPTEGSFVGKRKNRSPYHP